MKQTPPELLTLMKLAAELRATGSSWEIVGARVQRSPRTCREWPLRYPDDWKHLYCEAEDSLTAEGSALGRRNTSLGPTSGRSPAIQST